jgi:phosphatidylglycerophosphate synthase
MKHEARLRRFTFLQSVFLLGAALVAGIGNDARIAAIAGAASLVVLGALYAGRFTPSGGFGAANTVTALRVVIVFVLSGLSRVGPAAATLVVIFLALDGLDGYLARRPPSTASEFGARLDMETDALFVLAFGLKLAAVHRLGPWIVVPGLLRYAYGAVVSIVPRLGEAPRSQLGRVIAGLMMTSLAVSAWPVETVHRPLAAVAAVLVVFSFVRSATQSVRREERAGEQGRGETPPLPHREKT